MLGCNKKTSLGLYTLMSQYCRLFAELLSALLPFSFLTFKAVIEM